MKNNKQKLHLLIFILSVFSFQCQGQADITGKIIDENINPVEFANFTIYNNNKIVAVSISDNKGIFKSKINQKFERLKIIGYYLVGNGQYCLTDTLMITSERKRSDTIWFLVNTQNCDKKEFGIIEERHTYIREGFYYVDFSDLTNNEMQIVKGEEILNKEYSPYDYQIILSDKKYKDNNGKIYTGQELIKMRKLSLNNWNNNDFVTVENE